jgi:hypothetical protein
MPRRPAASERAGFVAGEDWGSVIWEMMSRTRPIWRSIAPLLLFASAWAQAPLGEMFVTAPGAPAVEQPAGTGMAVLPGSELSAGMAPAVLRLARGGQVRLCPRSHMSVNSGGQGLMLGMGVGAAEVDYGVAAGATDVVFTPDFEIRLAGPAHYHFALGVSAGGDTCFKPLLGNTSGVVFSELLGQEIFGAGGDEATLFPEGKVARRAPLSESCGCPAPPLKQVALQPKAPEPSKAQEAPAAASADASSPGHGVAPGEAAATLTREQPGQTHVEVETPFVFSGNAAPIAGSVAKIQFSSLPNAVFTQEDPDPIVLPENPPAPAEAKAEPSPSPTPTKKEKKGFMARVKGFFGGLFHR